MEKENEFDLDSQNQSKGVEEIDFSDADVAKEAYQDIVEKQQKISDNNKQLFSRLKKAEGFELKDDKWVKSEAPIELKKPKNVETKESKEPSQPNELDYGQLALLRSEGIKSPEETALFKEIMTETGKSMLDVIDSNYFKSRLSDFREAQNSMNAIPKGKNRSGQTGATDVDIAVAKYKEDGTFPSDFKTRIAVVKALEAEEQSSGMFEGPAVIGTKR